jgi:pimeloyl-ACP methyl ester carboxylesterase
MAGRLGKALAVITLVLVASIAAGGAMTAVAGPFHPRGERVDIGGRSLRIVCEGPASDKPLVMMEAGAFGGAADFGAIQQKLAAKGVRSCAYDRAGMGWSDPGPKLRDTLNIVADFEALLKARGVEGPVILMGHSMAGLHLHAFAARNPQKVAGLVLIESAVPSRQPEGFERRFLPTFQRIARVGAVAASVGVMRLIPRQDRIGLPPHVAAEKARTYSSGRHMRTAANEVVNWRRSSEQGAELAPLDPRWPVAVILAGSRGETIDSLRASPARASRAGHFEAVAGAGHNTVLGFTYGDAAVRGVEHVLAHLSPATP